MSLGLDKVMLLISSYSNPVETLQHARRQGYILRDFMVTAMPFGKYSSEPKVQLPTGMCRLLVCVSCVMVLGAVPHHCMTCVEIPSWWFLSASQALRQVARSNDKAPPTAGYALDHTDEE